MVPLQGQRPACRQEHWFRLNNASQSSYNKAWTGYQAVASYDHINWFRIPTIFEGDCLRFSLEAEQTHAWFAYFEPYSRGRHDWLIEQALTKAGTELLATGKSVEGRDIQLLRKGTGAEGQRKVWIIAQQHPGEHMAEWFMEGVIERLEKHDDPVLNKLLASADLYLVPNMNPDGAFHGHLRTNAMGQDLNRAWQNASRKSARKSFSYSSRWKSMASICSSTCTVTRKSLTCSPPLAKAIRVTHPGSKNSKNTSATI